MNRQCLKCNHVNPSATGDALEACPACGAIYSRVEQAMASGAPVHKVAAPAASPAQQADVHEFVETMRADTLYPTFRGLANANAWLWNILAGLCGLGGLISLFTSSGSGRFIGLLGGAAFALFFYVMGKFFREMSHMLADLSDASVRTAAKLEHR